MGVGGQPGDDPLTPVRAAAGAARRGWQPDGSWADIDYAARQHAAFAAAVHLDRLAVLARAGMRSSADQAAADRALAYWPDRDHQSTNWFWDQIGTPTRLLPTLLLDWDRMDAHRRAQALTIMARAHVERSGTNLVRMAPVVAERGLLLNDPDLAATAYGRIVQECRASKTQSGGPQVDGSFMCHGPLLYSWGYGAAFVGDNTRLAVLLRGTRFAIMGHQVILLQSWVLDGEQWFARGGINDFGACGWEVSRKHHNARALVGMGEDLSLLGSDRAAELRAMAPRARGEDAPPLVGNKQFWRADTMAHHRPAWYASARLSSARTKNTETINGENLRGAILAEGDNVLMRSGRE